MSTATLAAGNVRPISAVKADFAHRLSQQPQSVYADIKAGVTYLPRQARAAVLRAARFLHVPQFAAFVRTNFSRFLGVVGTGAFTVEVLTSHWGQAVLRKTISTGARLTTWAVKWTWRIGTSPLRLFSPTKGLIEKIESGVAKANAKLTPNSGETFGPLQLVRESLGHALSADRKHMRLARTTAIAVMTIRATRRFVPAGWMRIAATVLDVVIIGRTYGELLEGTWLGRRLARRAAMIEADVARQGETVVATATHMTREAAGDVAQKLRAEADEVETEGAAAAEVLREETLTESATIAQDLREKAAAVENTAEKMEAAEAVLAKDIPSPVAVADPPKPGPVVPPAMGGRTPGSPGPSPQQKQRDKGRGQHQNH